MMDMSLPPLEPVRIAMMNGMSMFRSCISFSAARQLKPGIL